MNPVIEVMISVAFIVGALLSLTAAIGLVRFSRVLSRLHAATKPQVLGMLLLLLGTALQADSWTVAPVLVVAWVFQVLTVPVSAHMIATAAYRSHGSIDEWSQDDFRETFEALERRQEGLEEVGADEPT